MRSSPTSLPRRAMLTARALALSCGLLTAASSAPAQGSSLVPPGVEPQKYKQFMANLDELMRIQDPRLALWEVKDTRRMMTLLEENEKLGIRFPKGHEAIWTQNRLVENMHDHCRILSLASGTDAVLLRVGKTPEHADFGGLFTPKVSDFDQTIVGGSADLVRAEHLAVAAEDYGAKFVERTLTNLSLADGTIAAWTLEDVRHAYGTAVLDPEMHRTYSGLQFVEDNIISVGEISTLDESGLKLVTKSLKKDFAGNREAFIEYANGKFLAAGATIRFGKREQGFCLGLMSDISNQMWMNVRKELAEAKRLGAHAKPENHVKKYADRYVAQVRDLLKVDLAKDPAYARVCELIEACKADPARWGELETAMQEFERQLWKLGGERQSTEYAAALARGLTERAAAIRLDTEGAFQNSRLSHEPVHIDEGALGPLGQDAAKNLLERPLFKSASQVEREVRAAEAAHGEPNAGPRALEHEPPTTTAHHAEPHAREAPAAGAAADAAAHGNEPLAGRRVVLQAAEVFDRPSMQEVLRRNRSAIFIQVGVSLYAMVEALDKESDDQVGAVWDEAKTQAWDGILFTALPMAIEFTPYRALSFALGWGPMVIGLAELGYYGYKDYAYGQLVQSWVEPRISARLAGVLPNGGRLDAPDILSALGAPKTDSDYAIPASYVDGLYANGTLRVSHRADSSIVVEQLDPKRDAAMREWQAGVADGTLSVAMATQRPAEPVLHTWTYTPTQLVVERRLNRAFDALRQEWRAQHPNLGPRDSVLDMRALRPPYHLDTKLDFVQKVDRTEILYYLKRYREAVIQSQVPFNDATSAARQGPDGYRLETDLDEAVTRRFLEEMGHRAAAADAARQAFDASGPLALQAQLDAGCAFHIDGRDYSPADIQARIARITADGLRRARAANPMWLAWLKEHWDLDALSVPDLRRTELHVVSFTAEPAPQVSEALFRLVLHYQLNRVPEGGLRFYTVLEGDPAPPHEASPMAGDAAARSPGQDGAGDRIEVFGVSADHNEGKDKRVFMRVTTIEQDPVSHKPVERTLATTSTVVIPGERKQWVLEKFVQSAGPRSYSRASGTDSMTLEVKTEAGNVTLTGRVRCEAGGWSFTQLAIGPVPHVLTNFAEAGCWVVSRRAEHSYVPAWDRKQQEHSCGSFRFGFERNAVSGSRPGWTDGGVRQASDTNTVLVPTSRGTASEQAQAAARLGLAPPEKFAGEGAELDAQLYTMGPSEYFSAPERYHLVAEVGLNAPDATTGKLLRFDWYYRRALAGEILPTDTPLALGSPTLTSAGATQSSAGTAANPWGASLDGAHAAAGPWGGSVQTAITGSGPWGASLAHAGTGAVTAPASEGDGALGSVTATGTSESPGGSPTPDQMLSSSSPWRYPEVQAAMDEWLHAARPPVNDGTAWHYTAWGVAENGAGVRATHPDNEGMTRPQWLWTRCQRLTSADHCTLGEYVRQRLTGGSLDGCRGHGGPTAHAQAGNGGAAGPSATPRAPASGQAAPVFEARTLDGKRTVRLDELRGRTVLVSFWNPAAAHDREQYALLSEEYAARARELVVLSTAPGYAGDLKSVHAVVDGMRTQVQELLPDSSVFAPYLLGLQGTSGIYVIDSKGVVRGVYAGTLRGNWKAVEAIRVVAGIGDK